MAQKSTFVFLTFGLVFLLTLVFLKGLTDSLTGAATTTIPTNILFGVFILILGLIVSVGYLHYKANPE
ncbi:MAG TPA: hypothetical protein VJJ23_01930 [Candidatus Nanoarchaeia archaeon]|nr:hypothetical protein [Candidatus Nanoarchaeia archaeon]